MLGFFLAPEEAVSPLARKAAESQRQEWGMLSCPLRGLDPSSGLAVVRPQKTSLQEVGWFIYLFILLSSLQIAPNYLSELIQRFNSWCL